ncbi:MAG: hypothetical protein LBH76_01795 [Propionibacteriaceae bacterium]|nr:hypothetical protein [Propionibacteriaceae bacterium]
MTTAPRPGLDPAAQLPSPAGPRLEIRALTVRQPWAWAILCGGKDVENRSRLMTGGYRGPAAIHAALAFDDAAFCDPEFMRALSRAGMLGWPKDGLDAVWPRGVILGVADLADEHCGTGEGVVAGWPVCSRWAWENERAHLVLANPRLLPRPVPWKGRLGLWRLDPAPVPGMEESL